VDAGAARMVEQSNRDRIARPTGMNIKAAEPKISQAEMHIHFASSDVMYFCCDPNRIAEVM
jgi:hypothetical protein